MFIILDELKEAEEKHLNFPTPHHGWAVIQEEVEELWELVKMDDGHTLRAAKEALQVAASAMRYILNVTEMAYATTKGNKQANDTQEHRGISPRPDVRAYPGEIRASDSGPAGRGGGILAGAAVEALNEKYNAAVAIEEWQRKVCQRLIGRGFTAEAAAQLVFAA
jgi:hypothetical protein